MPTSYPTSLDDSTDLPPKAQLTGKKLDGSDSAGVADHDDVHDTIHGAIVAIETELGTDPSGGHSTVKDRIAAAESALTTHDADTTNVHGIADTSVLETTTGAQTKVDTHVNDTSAAHAASAISFSPASGIAATDAQAAIVEAKTDAQAYADSAVSTHNAVTTAHGISSFVAGALDETTVGAFLTALGIDADVATLAVPASTTISSFVAGALDETTLAAFLTALGLDADLATFSLPASTTISALGALIAALTTLTNHGVLIGQGSSAPVASTAGSAGQVFTSNGPSADPTFQALNSSGIDGLAGAIYATRQMAK